MANHRRGRINDAVAEELAIAIGNVREPKVINNFVSITRAEVAPDLKYATVYFSCMGDSKEALEGPLEEYIRSNEWPMGKVMNCLRLAMVGGSNGLGIADIVTLIGKEEFAKRIEFIKATLGC